MKFTLNKYYKAGYSPIPITKQKIPVVEWKKAQQEPIPEHVLDKIFRESKLPLGIGIVTGKVSGNLECLDFDLKYDNTNTLYEDYCEKIKSKNLNLYNKIVKIQTQSNGIHWIYRVKEPFVIPKNHAIAKRYGLPAENQEVVVLIETRGEGGYFATVPTPGYKILSGDLFNPPVITENEREILIDTALLFNSVTTYANVNTPEEQKLYDLSQSDPNDPLTDFNKRGNPLPYLIEAGWTVVSEDEDIVYLKRPGFTTSKTSAKLFKNTRIFYVHSTSTIFDAGKGYTPAAVYTKLKCADSYSRSRYELARLGYGNLKAMKHENTDVYVFYSGYELGLAQWLKHLLKDEVVIYFPNIKEIYIWRNSCWTLISESEFNLIISNLYSQMISELSKIQADLIQQFAKAKKEKNTEQVQILASKKQFCSNALASLQKKTIRENIKSLFLEGCTLDELNKDKYKHLIGFVNGVWDAEKSVLIPNEMRYYITQYSPYPVDLTAKAPSWKKFVNEIFLGDKELIHFIQMSIGYSLTGWQHQQYIWFALGGGKNGKSTFFTLFEKLFPAHCHKIEASILLSAGSNNTNAAVHKATLQGKKFVTTSEIPANLALQEHLIKDLTSGERMIGRKLYRDPFMFEATHKIWMSGNHMPYIHSTDFGIWRRILVIPFEYTVPDHKTRSTEEMIEEFLQEAPGIINWCLTGLKNYVKLPYHKLPIPQKVKDSSLGYKNTMDSVEMFMFDTFETKGSFNNSYQLLDVYNRYKAYCSERGLTMQAKSLPALELELVKKGWAVEVDPINGAKIVKHLILKLS